MTRPHEFTRKVKEAAYARAAGHCEECTAPLSPGKFRYDHDLPIAFGGESTLENCMVRCDSCDSAKTYGKDIPAIAKSNRQRARHIGAKRPRSIIAGSKSSRFKKKLDGTVEKRDA